LHLSHPPWDSLHFFCLNIAFDTSYSIIVDLLYNFA
jgi:hypothetical protein